MTRSNCLFVALRLWWRHGGYLLFRRSIFRLLSIHAAWSRDAYHWVTWVPNEPKHGILPIVWFPGHFERWTGIERISRRHRR